MVGQRGSTEEHSCNKYPKTGYAPLTERVVWKGTEVTTEAGKKIVASRACTSRVEYSTLHMIMCRCWCSGATCALVRWIPGRSFGSMQETTDLPPTRDVCGGLEMHRGSSWGGGVGRGWDVELNDREF